MVVGLLRTDEVMFRLEEERYQLGRLLERIDVSRFPLPITLRAGRHALEISMPVKDRETGAPTEVVTVVAVRREDYGGELRALARVVRCGISQLLMHEVDECLFVQGVRIFDPHRD